MQLTTADVARLCGVTEPEVHEWVERLALPATCELTQYQIQPAALLDWARHHQVKVGPPFFKSRHADRRPTASLGASLQRGGVVRHSGQADHATLLKALVESLPLPAQATSDALLACGSAADHLGAAPLGHGVAIPHPHRPVVLPVAEPVMRVCYLDEPLDLAAIDGRRVDVLFLLICPTVRVHLQLLARAAHALRTPAFRHALQRRGDLDALTAALAALEAGPTAPAHAA